MSKNTENQKGYPFNLVEVIDREITGKRFPTYDEAKDAMEDRYNRVIMAIEAQHGFNGAVDSEIDYAAGKAWVNDLNDDTHYDWAITCSEDAPAAESEPAATVENIVEVENDQLMLDNLCKAIQCTRSFGKVREDSNYILELKLIQKEDGWTDMWGKPHAGGKYVRIVWSNNPERSDGYYDLCVDATSTWGIITTVIDYLRKSA